MSEHKIATINSRKFDGTIYRTWTAELIDENNSLLTLVGEFEKEVKHPHLGVIRRGTVSYEFYWLDRWFNIFRFHEPAGDLRNFYCNINMPPSFESGVLDYIDLDVDILVWRDFSFEVLDLDDFAQSAEKYNYSDDLKIKVERQVEEIIKMIENRDFPFNLEF